MRYIGMAVINAISTTLWVCVMQNAINNTIEGQNLTIWQSLAKSYELYASLAGGLAILLIGDMHIELAIAIQCTANLLMGLTDLRAKSYLLRGDISYEQQRDCITTSAKIVQREKCIWTS